MGEALTDRGLLRTARLGIRLLKAAADAETPDTVPIAPKAEATLSITSHCSHQGLTTYAATGTHSEVHEHAQARTHALAYTRTGTHANILKPRLRAHAHAAPKYCRAKSQYHVSQLLRIPVFRIAPNL